MMYQLAARLFLSTLSLRRATGTESARDRPKEFLSTLSLRRATLATWQSDYLYRISIHALLAESDLRVVRGGNTKCISIHALLAESDNPWYPQPGGNLDFYPRSPCGERRILAYSSVMPRVFLSTLSLRRATGSHQEQNGVFGISIHALLAESDPDQSGE